MKPKTPQHMLIVYTSDWADEMTISGFRVMTSTEWNAAVERLNDPANYPQTHYVGSNEEIEYDTPSQMLSRFSARPIGDQFASNLKREFPRLTFGHFPPI